MVRQLSSRYLGHVAQTIDHFVQDKLTRAVFCIGMLMDALKLCPEFRTTVTIDLRGDQLQSGLLSECHARTIFPNGVYRRAFELCMPYCAKDVFDISIELDLGRFIVVVRCHDFHMRLVRGTPPLTIIL